jgi:hypothetical protein
VELFIEMEVIHACEPEKIASRVRIMEIPIGSDTISPGSGKGLSSTGCAAAASA